MTSTHKVTVMVEAATGIGADSKVSEAGVVETLLYAALLEAAEVVATTADVVVRARLSENESRDQGGKKECGTERRVKGEHGVKTDGRGRWPETAEGDSRERTRRKRGKGKGCNFPGCILIIWVVLLRALRRDATQLSIGIRSSLALEQRDRVLLRHPRSRTSLVFLLSYTLCSGL